ncbi:MAG: SAM-dependent chlorinase/fluorinase [Anaerolineae bacterium]|nr:SAM-dependent chlorinase/fluorinase [Chloroflexota bacterium]MBP6297740.1 SAM-dependent chlorinase/fluorinase [Anaerolineae bacterium]
MPIVLLTDFGLKDHYVGVMKGVISGIAPEAPVIDLSHGVASQDIRGGAVMLMQAVKYFPVGTIFCVVIDPGVGSDRRPVAVQAGGYWFVGPDNGVLSYALYNAPQTWAVDITNALNDEDPPSQTFHGRDLFAPVAALLYAGAPLESLGDPIMDMVGLAPPKFEVVDGWLHGEILSIDKFGNAMTSLGLFKWLTDESLTLRPLIGTGVWTVQADRSTLIIEGEKIVGIQQTYDNVDRDRALTLVGSSGFLELAVNHGNAAQQFGLIVGQAVRLKIEEG